MFCCLYKLIVNSYLMSSLFKLTSVTAPPPEGEAWEGKNKKSVEPCRLNDSELMQEYDEYQQRTDVFHAYQIKAEESAAH